MSLNRRVSVKSLEFVQAAVRGEKDGVEVDPTADPVAMAFVAVGAYPAGGDWKPAQWETETKGPLKTYLASCLVGPGGIVTLAAGRYAVYVKVTDNPEVPVIAAGVLTVY